MCRANQFDWMFYNYIRVNVLRELAIKENQNEKWLYSKMVHGMTKLAFDHKFACFSFEPILHESPVEGKRLKMISIWLRWAETLVLNAFLYDMINLIHLRNYKEWGMLNRKELILHPHHCVF